MSTLLDALLPAACAACERPLPTSDPPLCPDCERALPWWRHVDGCPVCGAARPIRPDPSAPAACPTCLARGSGLHLALALTRYEDPIRRWIPAFKRGRGPFGPPVAMTRVVFHLADALARAAERAFPDRPDWITGVPSHRLRRLRRGFDHVDPIARRVAVRLDVPWRPELLVRARATRPQAALEAEARRRNLAGAFRATRPLPSHARVWLVDDVLTTGGTLEAAADALIDAGALEVRALTLAATLPASRRRPGPSAEAAGGTGAPYARRAREVVRTADRRVSQPAAPTGSASARTSVRAAGGVSSQPARGLQPRRRSPDSPSIRRVPE